MFEFPIHTQDKYTREPITIWDDHVTYNGKDTPLKKVHVYGIFDCKLDESGKMPKNAYDHFIHVIKFSAFEKIFFTVDGIDAKEFQDWLYHKSLTYHVDYISSVNNQAWRSRVQGKIAAEKYLQAHPEEYIRELKRRRKNGL